MRDMPARPARLAPRTLAAAALLLSLSVTARPAAGQAPSAPSAAQAPPAPAITHTQTVDPDFRTRVEHPAFTGTGERPVLVIDEAHQNHHTAGGGYKPFADLAAQDGFEVVPGKAKLDAAALAPVRILVIANALGEADSPAFTEAECDAVLAWVKAGGSLLLIADHAPFGGAVQPLARRFGVEMGAGFVSDPGHSQPDLVRFLTFSRDNGLLAEHPITRGREPRERVGRVMAFAGQSLSIPPGAASLLTFGKEAVEGKNRDFPSPANVSVTGRSQGLALTAGKGRVVVLGEAGMFSAQVSTTREEGKTPDVLRFGMNVPGHDNVQFALNVLHWLAGVLR